MSSEQSGDEYAFFKQNVVPQRQGGSDGFNADDAGRGVGGPSGTATESVAGTATADAGVRVSAVFFGGSWMGILWSLCAVGLGVVVGAGVL